MSLMESIDDREELLAAIEGLAYAMKHDLRVDDRIKFGQHREELIETLGDQLWQAVKIDNKAVYAANKALKDKWALQKISLSQAQSMLLAAHTKLALSSDTIDGLNSEIEVLSDTEDNLHQVCEDYDKHVIELDTEIRHLRTINSSMHKRLTAYADARLGIKYNTPKQWLGIKWSDK